MATLTGKRRLLGRMFAGAAIALAALGEPAAQPADVDPFDWGYAAAFGSGTYRLSDGTETRIYRGAFVKRLRETPGPDERGAGLRLLLPVTAGVQNLDDAELPPGRPADEVEQAAFLPGIELELMPGERWTVRAHAQLGYGVELEGAERSARLAATGLRSRLLWPDAPARPAWISGLLWAAFDPDGGEQRSLLRLTQALELDVAVPRWRFRGQTMRLLPHVLGDWFYRPPPALAFGDEGFERLEDEWQIGVAAGRTEGFRLLGFRFDSVGVAYRFSEHSEGLRLYVHSIF